MSIERVHYLLDRYLADNLTSSENEEWKKLLTNPEMEEIMKTSMEKPWSDIEPQVQVLLSAKRADEIAQTILSAPQDARQRALWPRFVAAASILLILSFGGYYLLYHQQSDKLSYYRNDVSPGRNQATLTLANGKKIVLTKDLYKTLTQSNAAIQINNGIIYKPSIANKTGVISYNTLSTASGEQSPYALILADGSRVWLNAQSSITFPTAFNSKERIVKVTGEAFFEVVHNAKQPFIVQAGKQTVEDLGTTFDVNSYTDEPAAKTTLIQGKIKVNNMLLLPGEQTDGDKIKTVNVKKYTAWQSGDFYFEDDNIQTVMRQLSRWYNIDVKYEGNITTDVFEARISRGKSISTILHILENTNGVHFKIDGRRVTVMQ